ncbi:class I SAM-dependent methyltransferase [Gilliamella sp. W8145]|uniref:class I SAM-dependent methyltransferase n=1 Tax=Gilliamella sp. W8145 TaxID=2750990 RepID=UPI0018DB8C56|nr:class I SAM-dependent methyltransferase [Gilliamella sp. W8145]MBI0104482.1 methyltransferase domain-containing protein [Gilliamella sp. W8145]
MEQIKKEAGHKFLARLGKTRLRPGGKKATEWLFKQAEFTPQSRVLEIACNMATTSIDIAKRFNCHIIGIDMDKSALAKAKQNVIKNNVSQLVDIQQADASKLPFADNSFDVVINEAMLTMYADKTKARLLNEYFRVLKPGGKLLTHDIMLDNPENSQDVMAQIHNAINVNAQPMSHDDWINLFSTIGFINIKSENAAMTLMSPRGMITDEGFFGAIKIVGNALHKQNRPQFIQMFKTFRKNKKSLNYIAICSVKPK